MTEHELKTWPQFYEPLARGDKTFELRREDRAQGFAVGDVLWLREFTPGVGLTGRDCRRRVSYVLRAADLAFAQGVLEQGYVILALAQAPAAPTTQDFEQWVKRYIDALLEFSKKAGDTAMGRAAMLRADHAMDLVTAFRQRDAPRPASAGREE